VVLSIDLCARVILEQKPRTSIKRSLFRLEQIYRERKPLSLDKIRLMWDERVMHERFCCDRISGRTVEGVRS